MRARHWFLLSSGKRGLRESTRFATDDLSIPETGPERFNDWVRRDVYGSGW
jgi:hypothetical protein